MMNFQVPQFIEIEDKIFGPLSFKQFVYLAGAGGISFVFWVYIPYHFLAVLLILPVLALGLALAFYRINNRPFILALEAAFRYALTHKLYIWQHSEGRTGEGKNADSEIAKLATTPKALIVPKLSESKLKDLAWSLDIREKIK